MPSIQPTAEEAGRVETNAPMRGECDPANDPRDDEVLAAMFLAKGVFAEASAKSIEQMSEFHEGQIGLMAQIAGTATSLEAWATDNVDFNEFGAVWLYDVVEDRLAPMLVKHADENGGCLTLSDETLHEIFFREAITAAGEAASLNSIQTGGMKP